MVKSKIHVVDLNGFEKPTNIIDNDADDELENNNVDTNIVENNELIIYEEKIEKPKPKRKSKKKEIIDNNKPDALDDIINETPEIVIEKTEEVVKEKVKRKPRIKKIIETPEKVEEKVEEKIEEKVEDKVEEKKPKKIKTVELEKCTQCGKEMTLRTLRYTHPKMCAGKKIDRNEIPVKRRITKSKEENITPNINNIPEEIIVNHIRKEREKKNQEKVEKIKKLVSSIV